MNKTISPTNILGNLCVVHEIQTIKLYIKWIKVDTNNRKTCPNLLIIVNVLIRPIEFKNS